MNYSVIGIDLASWCTGYSVFDVKFSKYHFRTSGLIHADDKKAEIQHRLWFVRNSVENLLKRYKPKLVVLEDIYLSSRGNKGGRNAQTFKTLAMFHGVVIQLLTEYKIKFIYYAPTTIKAEIIKGNASKEEVEQAVIKRLNLKKDYFEYLSPRGLVRKKDDESDAVAVALTYFLKKEKRK